ncbi:hypothetical protein CUR178_03822 [Leishmania enriettii]|uniref:Uncharacterized protein n=1 Tax=Leishmania enriettii TaxID=5663 RepID=A0A836GPX5_LEIEN|nr:hypothetical protein CUR178_03822 [Leishmania enriettii]
MLTTAQQMCALDVAVDDDDQQPFFMRNGMTCALPSAEAAAYQRRCLESSLLREYMEPDELLSLGSLAKGALGPHSPRRGQPSSALPKSSTTTSDFAGSNAQKSAALLRSPGAPRSSTRATPALRRWVAASARRV